MANHMSEVAKMLGVEIGEKFRIIHVGSNKSISEYDYYFTNKDIEIDKEGRACSGEYLLTHLVYGDFSDIKVIGNIIDNPKLLEV